MTKKISIAQLYALITAIGIVVFTFILYKSGVHLYLGGIAYLGIAFLLLMAILAALAQKKANGGAIPFQEALRIAFTIIAVGFAAQTLFNWILMNFIDTHFKQQVIDETLRRTEKLLRDWQYPPDKIEHDMAEQKASDPYSIRNQTMGFAIYSIVGFIFALIIAAIVKTKKTSPAGS